MKTPPRLLYLPAIDGLRGIAILMVLAVHTVDHVLLSGNRNWAFPDLERYFRAGVVGVHLFFLVSAFTLFQRMEERHGQETSPIAAFYIRRIFRIIPLWWIAVLVQASLTDWPLSRGNILAHIFLYFGFTHYPPIIFTDWSLFVEESFYIFLPFLFPLLRRFSHALGFFLLALGIHFVWTPDSLRVFRAGFPGGVGMLPRYFYCFFLGILLQKIYFGGGRRKSIVVRRWATPVLDFLTLSAIVLFVWRGGTPGTLSMAALFLVALSGRGVFAYLSETRWLGSFGKRSYSIYLIHPILSPATGKFGSHLFDFLGVRHSCVELRILLILPVYVLASWGLAGITLRWIEKPYIEVGKSWIRSLQRKKLKEKLGPNLAADSGEAV